MSAIEDFKQAIRDHGFAPPSIIEPGRIHRFSTNGKPSDDAGWCKLFTDEFGGVFGDHRSGMQETWRACRDYSETQEERSAFTRKVEEARRQREAEDAERRAAAEMRAATIWNDCDEV